MNAKFMTAAAVAFSLGAMACSPAVSMSMQNPLQSGGKVHDNAIDFPQTQLENRYELPRGSLTHTASLAKLTKKKVCFDVTVRSLEERRDLASPKGWRVFLRGEPEFEDKRVKFEDLEDLKQEVVSGSVQKSETKSKRICDDHGNCWNENSTVTFRVPKDFKILTGEASVCFKNRGHIKKSTEEITLHLDDPNPDFANEGGGVNFFAALTNRVAFRWKFN